MLDYGFFALFSLFLIIFQFCYQHLSFVKRYLYGKTENLFQITKTEIIKEGNELFGDIYDYTILLGLKKDKFGTKEKIPLKCKHKVYEQAVEGHLRGFHACRKCGAEQKK